MKGFKNTTRTQYSMGGDVGGYAKGGMAKGAAKISKVMGEFKKGELHSGSKDGPKVTKPAQAKAIAMSEARKAGMKAPMKKNEGGKVGKMPPIGESVKSGNRMSKLTAADMRALEARFGEKKRPSPADSVRSANRISAQEGAEARRFGVFNEGGKVRKYAEGGPARKTMPPSAPMPDLNETMSNLRNQFGVMGSSGQYDMQSLQDLVNNVGEVYRQRGATPDQVKNAYMQGFANLQKTPSGVGSAPGGPAKPSFDASYHYQNLGANLKDMIDSGKLTIEQANALKAPAFEATRLRDVGQQQQAMQAALDAVYGKQPGVDNAPLVYSPIKQFDASASYQKFGSDLKDMIDSGQLTMEQANALRAPAFEATRLRDPKQQEQAMYAAIAAAGGQVPPSPTKPIKPIQPIEPTPPIRPTPIQPIEPTPPPVMMEPQPMPTGVRGAPGVGIAPMPPRKIYEPQRPPHYDPFFAGNDPPADFGYGPSEPPTNPLYAELGRGLGNLGPKRPPVDPGFVIGPRDMPSVMPMPPGGFAAAIGGELNNLRPTKVPRTPGGGMGLLEQRQPRMPEKNVTMMKKGGRTAMPKGKR